MPVERARKEIRKVMYPPEDTTEIEVSQGLMKDILSRSLNLRIDRPSRPECDNHPVTQRKELSISEPMLSIEILFNSLLHAFLDLHRPSKVVLGNGPQLMESLAMGVTMV